MKVFAHMKAGSGFETAFYRSRRSMGNDGFRLSLLWMLLVALLLAAWLAWFFLARVARYEVSDEARLEVDQAIYRLQAPVSGRVVTSHLVLGQEIRSGDVVIELDSAPQRLELAQERARLAAFLPQITALMKEVEAVKQAIQQERQASTAALQQAKAQTREGEALARFAEQEAERFSHLRAQGLIAERDFMQGTAEAERRRAAAESLQLAPGRLEREQKVRESERQAQIEGLQSEITRLQGQRSMSAAAVDRLQYEIERRLIRAPASGRLGQVATLRAGAFVDEADDLGAVVPAGGFKVVAQFLPTAALGRLRREQPGRLRLHGYPWTQYGSVRTTVASVGNEIRDGKVRVEFNVIPGPNCRVPLQHGLPGTVEVQIERLSPAMLVLRAAGRLIASPQEVFGREETGASGGGRSSL